MPKWIKANINVDALQINWSIAHWMIDIKSASEFYKECKHTLSSHQCRTISDPDTYNAKFIKKVNKNTAILDYTDKAVKAYNTRHGILMGKCKLIFTSPERTKVKEVIWIDDKGAEHPDAATTSWDRLPDLENQFHIPKGKKGDKVLTKRKRRELQTKFRGDLFDAYNYKCCISGCDVPEALEAVHIVTASSRQTYDPRNGLLLRVDLHRLFDKNLMQIHPNSRKVLLRGSILKSEQYKQFHRKRISEPEKKYAYRPAKEALLAKWKIAQK